MINKFYGKYSFLSNFWPCEVAYDGVMYVSVEHAYQAAKTEDKEERLKFHCISAAQAKKLGKTLKLREDWDDIKYDVMVTLIQDKFSRNHDLRKQLLETGNEELIEGNWWHDTYWGVCNGIGENNLGKILMAEREFWKTAKGQIELG